MPFAAMDMISNLLTPGSALPFLTAGVIGGVGDYIFASAFRYAPAAILAAAFCPQLFFVGFFDRAIFGNRPGILACPGMGGGGCGRSSG